MSIEFVLGIVAVLVATAALGWAWSASSELSALLKISKTHSDSLYNFLEIVKLLTGIGIKQDAEIRQLRLSVMAVEEELSKRLCDIENDMAYIWEQTTTTMANRLTKVEEELAYMPSTIPVTTFECDGTSWLGDYNDA